MFNSVNQVIFHTSRRRRSRDFHTEARKLPQAALVLSTYKSSWHD